MDQLTKIMPSGNVKFTIYRVVTEAFVKAREMKILDPIYTDEKKFSKEIQIKGYITVRTDSADGKINIIILNRDKAGNSPIVSVTENMKNFIKTVCKSGARIMAITPSKPSAHVETYLSNNIKKDKFILYPYDTFKIVLPLAPHVPKHKIISDEETKKRILDDFNIDASRLKKISVDCPQMVWIGAKIGDLIQIVNFSQLTGYSDNYRIVI